MRKLLVPLMVLTCLVVPAMVPNIGISTNPPVTMTAATTLHVPIVNVGVSISPGGTAQAWNLIYELCRAGVPGMCDLYWHGESEGWWVN